MLALSRALAVRGLASLAALAAACGGDQPARKAQPGEDRHRHAAGDTAEPQILGQAVAQPGGGSSYTVKSGDTLAGIASRFGVSLEDLRAANANIDGRPQRRSDRSLTLDAQPPRRPTLPAAHALLRNSKTSARRPRRVDVGVGGAQVLETDAESRGRCRRACHRTSRV